MPLPELKLCAKERDHRMLKQGRMAAVRGIRVVWNKRQAIDETGLYLARRPRP